MQGLLTNIKKYAFLGFLLIVLFFIIWLKFVVSPIVKNQEKINLTPTPTIELPKQITYPRPTINKAINVLSVGSYKYSGSIIKIPDKINIYSPAGPADISPEEASRLAALFNFTGNPNDKDTGTNGAPFYLWSSKDGNRVFSIGGSFPALKFNDFSFNNGLSIGISVSNEELINKTKILLDKIGLKNVDYAKIDYSYLKATDKSPESLYLEKTNSKEEASFVSLGFTYNLGGFSSFTNTTGNFPISVVFTGSGDLYELTAYIIGFNPSSKIITPVSFNDSLKRLGSDSIIISAISASDKNLLEPSTYKLKEVNLDNASLVYYVPVEYAEFFYPFYVFTGKAEDQETNKSVEVVVLLPV